MSSTECGTGGCATEQSSCGAGATSCCPCGSSSCSGDPIECGVGMWTGSFFQALKAVQVEALKAKIHKAWGAKMDKAADAVLEAMGVQWQSMLAQTNAQSDLQEKLRGLWSEGKSGK